MMNIDVLCAGHASYDLIFNVDSHPGADQKVFANNLISCGGGPAANAAVTVSRLGYSAAFCGYLGNDLYGDKHYSELQTEQINTQLVQRRNSPTPLSTILVKPDGQRTLINYKGDTLPLESGLIDYPPMQPKVMLFDGHEPEISQELMQLAKAKAIPTILDAGSVHDGTRSLMHQVEFLVCSEKFAMQYAGDVHLALQQLTEHCPVVIITLGEQGIIWNRYGENGSLPALPIQAIDTTGAGDAFHGAFAAAIAAKMEWLPSLKYASIAGTCCCQHMSARLALPDRRRHQEMLQQFEEFLTHQDN